MQMNHLWTKSEHGTQRIVGDRTYAAVAAPDSADFSLQKIMCGARVKNSRFESVTITVRCSGCSVSDASAIVMMLDALLSTQPAPVRGQRSIMSGRRFDS